MKQTLRSIFKFILSPLESGNEPYQLKPFSRSVLITVGVLFTFLGSSVVLVYFFFSLSDLSFLLPSAIFTIGGLFCLIVGLLGNDRAVAKIWGSR